jgi:hypothetical protein
MKGVGVVAASDNASSDLGQVLLLRQAIRA